MHLLLTQKDLDRVDFLLLTLRHGAQTLLDTDDMPRAVHDVAATIEVLEEMFHVEHRLNLHLITGSGTPFSMIQGMHGESTENPGSSRNSDNHVREPVELGPTGLAPDQTGPFGSRWARTFLAAHAIAKSRPRPRLPRRGRHLARRRR